MKREFIHAQHFDKCWKALGLTDDNLRELEDVVLEQPDIGDIIQGTGGLRKMRFATDDRGKSGSLRVLYVDFEAYETASFLFAYPKSATSTITDKQKQAFKRLISEILDEMKKQKGV